MTKLENLLRRLDDLQDHYSVSGQLGSKNRRIFAEAAVALRAATRPAQEPVAWRYQRKEGWGDIWRCSTLPVNFETPSDWTVQPLFTLSGETGK